MSRAAALTVLALLIGAPLAVGSIATAVLGTTGTGWTIVTETPGLVRSLALSAWTALASTLVSLALAHVWVARGGVRRRTYRGFALPVIAMPHVAVAIGLALALAPSGLVLRMLSPWASGLLEPPSWQTIRDPWGMSLIVGLVLKETPFLVLSLLAAKAQIPADRLLLQARTLGHGPLRGWLLGVAPLLQRQVHLPLAAVLVFGISNVEMAIPLGPDLPPPFAVLVWRWFAAAALDQRDAAFAGALLLSGLAFATWLALRAVGMAASRALRRAAFHGPHGASGATTLRLSGMVPGGILALGLLAMAALAARTLSPQWRFPAVLPTDIGAGTLAWVPEGIWSAARTSLVLGLVTASAAVCLTLWATHAMRDSPGLRRFVSRGLAIPLLLPSMAFLFGFQWMLLRLQIEGTWTAVAWAHLVFALPYVWGILEPAHAELDPRLLHLARTLGVGGLSAWARVTLPLMLRAILLASAIGFSVSNALYLATIFPGAGHIDTLATGATTAAASGLLRPAAVHATWQAALPLLALGAAMLGGTLLYRDRAGVPR